MHIFFKKYVFFSLLHIEKKVLLLKIGDSCCTYEFSDVDLGKFFCKNVKNCSRRLAGLLVGISLLLIQFIIGHEYQYYSMYKVLEPGHNA